MVGRKAEIDRVVAELVDGPVLVVLRGPPGVGRTRLLSAVALELRSRGLLTETVFGVPSGRTFPFSPFIHLIDEVGSAAEAEVLWLLQRRFRTEGSRQVLLIDDAQLLDPASIVLVQHLVGRGEVGVVVALNSGEAATEGITALVGHPNAVWVDLGDLGRDESARLANACANGELRPDLLDQIWRRSGGNPFAVTELVKGGFEAGSMELDEDGYWNAVGSLGLTRRLSDTIARRVERLGPGRDLVGLIAMVGSLSANTAAELVGDDVVGRCVDSGIIHQVGELPCRRLEIAISLYSEVVVAALSEPRRRQLTRWLLDHPPSWDHGCPEEIVVYAEMLDRVGEGTPEQFRRAAEISLNRLDAERALRFADMALARGGGALERLVRALALSRIGRREEAQAIADELARERDPAIRATTSYHFAWSLLSDLGDRHAAVARVEDAIASLPDAVADPLRLQAINLRFHAGDPDGVMAEVRDLVASRSRLLDGVAIGVVNASTALGRPDIAAHYITTQWRRVRSGGSVGIPSSDLSSIAAMSLLWNWQSVQWQMGQLDQLVTPTSGLGPPDGTWSVLCGSWLIDEALPATLAWIRGSLQDARRRLDAVLRSAPIVPVPLLSFLGAGLATVAAMLGDRGIATAALDSTPAVEVGTTAGYWWRARAEIHVLAVEGRCSEAVNNSLDLAELYRGQEFFVTTCLHDVVRFGGACQVADRLRAQANRPHATWWDRVCSDHAAAHGDTTGLIQVADRFAAGGRLVEALEAAAQGSAVARAGSEDHVAALGRVAKWSTEVGRLRTPALLGAPKFLTERELVVARMAAEGRTNGEIASALGTSARTVGNQLQAVYQKLGVNSRSQLAPLLD